MLVPDFGREIHPAQFLAGNIIKAAALGWARTIFYLDKVNRLVLLGDNIDFAYLGLPVAVNDFKVLLLQQIADG